MSSEEEEGSRSKDNRWPLHPCSSCSATEKEEMRKTMSTYLGLSFSIFLGLLPQNTLPYITSLQSRNRVLALRLFEAEERLRQAKDRRREDGRANARAAEILAEHRSAWRETERGLLARISDANAVESELRAKIESLQRELERELSGAVARAGNGNSASDPGGDDADDDKNGGGIGTEEVSEEEEEEEEEGLEFHEETVGDGSEFDEIAAMMYRQRLQMQLPTMDSHGNANFHRNDANWFDLANAGGTNPVPSHIPWQGLNYDAVESMGGLKHVTPRESPWKIDLESSGVPNKLKVLEEELVNLENVGKGDLSKIPSLMRKQAKRYQSLSLRIDDLCKRMRASDPYDPALGAELRIQRQTEFLMEAKHLQHRATETRLKLTTVQSETLSISRFSFAEECSAEAKLRTRRSLDSVRNNFKEIQRNLEVWLARILGDLEGMLASNGASRMREYTGFW